MSSVKCLSYIGIQDGIGQAFYLKHSWVPQGHWQKCVHCRYMRTMTKVFKTSWDKLEKQLDKIK